jgi:hypothetical protein
LFVSHATIVGHGGHGGNRAGSGYRLADRPGYRRAERKART